MQKMFEEFKYFSRAEYSKMSEFFDTKKAKIEAHFKENKDILRVTFERVVEILEQASSKFDFSSLLKDTELREVQIYKSNSAGVMDWEFPAKEDLAWDNPLTAIVGSTESCEFNFVFKNGQKSSIATDCSET
jgi:hypothetical protein